MYFRRSVWLLAIALLAAVSFSSEAQTRSSAKTSKQSNPTTAPAQPAVWESWDTLKPENEDFSILMPKDASTEITKFDYHKLELNARLYMSAPATGPVVAVASMSGIKSNPAAYSDFERFNSYADAFKQFFPSKVRKDPVTKMILTTTKQFHGYTGRVYKLTVGDLSGTVNAYVTRKRFYAIAVLSTKKDDALEEKFLGSFVIPDKPAEQKIAAAETTEPNAVAQSENNEQGRPMRKPRVETEGTTNNNGTTPTANANTTEETVDSNNSQAQQGTPQKKAPISGGVLNSKAIYLPAPEMPPGEKPGVVMVQVLVDEQGTVIDARAVSGPPNLQTAAIIAARLARFLPTVLSGEPVKVSGTLAYNFVHSN